MGFLDGLLKGGGKVVQGAVNFAPYAEQAVDRIQARKLRDVSEQQKTEAFKMQQALANRTLNTPVLGDPRYADAMGAVTGAQARAGVQPAIDREAGIAPIRTQEAISTARGVAPIKTQEAIDTAAGTEPIRTQGAINTAAGTAPIRTQEAINTARGTEPIKTQGAIDTARGVTPIHTNAAIQQHETERVFDNAHPAPETPAIMQGTNPDGTPAFFRIPKKAGDAVRIEGATPKVAAGTGGQNAPSMAAAKANMESARKYMDDFEAKLKAGTAKYGIIDATMGALASSPAALNAKGPLGAVESFGANASSSHLQSANPELARYMAAKKYVAEAILNTHKRPNQTQYEIEQELSGAGPNPSIEQIDMGKARRDRMFDEVFDNPNAGGMATKGAGPRASSGDPEAAWAAKHPPQPGESFESYHQRFLKTGGGD